MKKFNITVNGNQYEVEVEEIKDFFYAAAGKKIFLFKAICSLTGFMAGIVTLVILSFL